jgi:hypothetical protein
MTSAPRAGQKWLRAALAAQPTEGRLDVAQPEMG